MDQFLVVISFVDPIGNLRVLTNYWVDKVGKE